MGTFKIRSAAGNEVAIKETIPAELQVQKIPGASEIYACGNFGNSSFQELLFAQGAIWHSLYRPEHNAVLLGELDVPVIELYASLSKPFRCIWDNIGVPTERINQFGLSYAPYVSNTAYLDGGQEYENFDFHFSAEALQSYAHCSPKLDRLLESIEKKQPANIDGDHFLSMKMLSIIKDIRQSDCHPALRARYNALKADEFLISAINIMDPADKKPFSIIPGHLIDKAHEIAFLLESAVDSQPRIADLARMVASNTQSIQVAFKAVYGITIFEYGRKLRLERAYHTIINEPEKDLDIVAMESGYRDLAGLCNAFRKMYGYTPGWLRRHQQKGR